MFCAALLCCALFTSNSVAAQPSVGGESKAKLAKVMQGQPDFPGKVEVQPVVKHDDIKQRLTDILSATGWFG